MLQPKTLIIAEAKTHSKFEGQLTDKPWDEVFWEAEKTGDAVSVLTDWDWRGSFELIARARRMTTKPIIAKGFHYEDKEVEWAINNGADWVLAVGRLPGVHLDRCLIEPETIDELRGYAVAGLTNRLRIVWNSRNLATGGLKRHTFADAREIWKGLMCQASNIHTVEDVHDTADAVLVGTHRAEFAASLANS